MCASGKKVYMTRKHAHRAIKLMKATGRGRMRTYWCCNCKFWHLTSQLVRLKNEVR